MSLGPNAGTAHITVKPSLRGWSEDVRRQLQREQKNMPAVQLQPPDSRTSQRSGEKAGNDFASGFDRMVRKRIQGALSSLPKTEIGVSTSEAEQRLKDVRAELDTLSKKRIGIDVDAQTALTRLHELQVDLERLSAESVDINVKADTVLASAQLAAIHREVNALDRDDVSVRVGVNGAPAATGALAGLGEAGGLAATRLGAVAAAGVILIPVLAQLVTLGATLATTLVAAGGGLGAVLAGVLGNILPVIKAQSELKQKQQEAASAAEAYASAQNSVRSATEAVASAEVASSRAISDAQRGVADARRNAARSIVSAEEAIVSAQQQRANAQRDLTDAIEAARKKLADYQLQLRSAALDEAGAALSVTQAQEALNQVLADPTSTQLQIDLARQSLKESQLSYDEASKRRKDLREQAAKDRKAGVQGDKGVLDAKDRLADANRAVAQAETRLAQARADGARSVANAERNLARARADGARQVAQARENLANAQRAEAAAAAKNAAAQKDVQDHLDKLSGPAAVFVKALDRAKKAWHDFLGATAHASFGLAAQGLNTFSKLLPKFEPLVRRSSKAVGSLLKDFARFMNGKEGKSFIRWLTRAAPGAIRTVGHAIGNIVIGIGGLLGALSDTDTGFLDLTKRFRDFGEHAGTNSTVQRFFDYAKKNGPLVADAIKAMADVAVNFIKVLAIVGPWLLRIITILLRVEAVFYKAAAGIVNVVRHAWSGIVLPALKAVWRFITNDLIPAVVYLWKHVVRPVFSAIGDFIQGVWKRLIHPYLQAWWYFLDHTLIPVLKVLWEKVVKPIFGWIADKVVGTWNDHIHPALSAFRDFIRDTLPGAFSKGVEAIKTVWNDLRKAVGTPVKFVVDTVYNNGLRKVINAIPGVDDVDEIDTSGWPSFARGGVLPGYTPGRDVHRFVSPTAGILNLSGGEGILIPQAVRQLGGAGGIAYLNDRARRGRLSLRPLIEQSHRTGGTVYIDGEPMSSIAAAQLAVAEHASGIPMRVIQGSYQPYTSYSKGSHMGGGVMDTSPGSFLAQSWLRKLAFAAWARNIPGAAYAGSGAHVHSVSLIDPTVTNTSQIAAYKAGQDGLGGSDYGPRPAPNMALVQSALRLAGSLSSTGSGGGTGGGGLGSLLGGIVGGGNPLAKFLDAIDAVKDFASSIPDMLSRLANMGPWGGLLKTGVRSLGGGFRDWVNGKIPGPGPFPDVFDRGGLAVGRGLLLKNTIRPERILDPDQTAAFDQLVATLSRNERALAHAGGMGSRTVLDVARFRIVDWDKGLAELEYMATSAAEQVLQAHNAHDARIADLSTDY